jgi:peptidoglycan/xylan/chitin deacetylase (PgdA/CDA1 family)
MPPHPGSYQADPSLKGKLKRRIARVAHRRPQRAAPDRPILSITFDDAPVSATRAGAEILEARGLRGTYYVSAGLSGTTGPMGICAGAEDYRRVAAAGHEIACHTYSHLDCGRASSAAADADVTRNLATLEAWGVGGIESFAYPYGDVSAGPKGVLKNRFSTLRAVHHGVIERGADLNQIPSVGIEGPPGPALARRWMSEALRRRAWLVLFTHDIGPTPSFWGCTPEVFRDLIDEVLAAGFEVLTVRDAARRLGA